MLTWMSSSPMTQVGQRLRADVDRDVPQRPQHRDVDRAQPAPGLPGPVDVGVDGAPEGDLLEDEGDREVEQQRVQAPATRCRAARRRRHRGDDQRHHPAQPDDRGQQGGTKGGMPGAGVLAPDGVRRGEGAGEAAARPSAVEPLVLHAGRSPSRDHGVGDQQRRDPAATAVEAERVAVTHPEVAERPPAYPELEGDDEGDPHRDVEPPVEVETPARSRSRAAVSPPPGPR